MSFNKLKVVGLREEAAAYYTGHSVAHKGDSGVDLFCLEDQVIKAGETDRIKLGIKAAVYDKDGNNVSWMLFPRSSLSKTPLRLAGSIGLMDAGYRGELTPVVDNIRSEDFKISKGDKLFQVVAFNGVAMTVEMVESLDETERGEGGFGSTGLNGARSNRDINETQSQ